MGPISGSALSKSFWEEDDVQLIYELLVTGLLYALSWHVYLVVHRSCSVVAVIHAACSNTTTAFYCSTTIKLHLS